VEEFTSSQYLSMNEYLREYEFDDPELGVAKVCQSPGPEYGLGSTVWDAALVLCAFLESAQGRELVKGTRVVELGAGTGIVSIVADKLGASSTLATDLPEYVPFIRQNIGMNVGSECRAGPLDWKAHDALPSEVDWVLCADCVYLSDTVDDLVATIVAINPKRGVIVSNEAREHDNNAEAERNFIKGLYAKGFSGKAVHRDVLKPEWRCDDIHVVVFERQSDDRVRDL
jgi:predicted RNA methylase